MDEFDVVIVGGGPAGGHCARRLAKAGCRVLLVERHKNFAINSFSSAGVPLEALQQYELPDRVVGAYWREFVVVTSTQKGVWAGPEPRGAVLDFGQLREFLATETRSQGGTVWMGWRYVSHQETATGAIVTLKQGTETRLVQTQVVVDATGPSRAVMATHHPTPPDYLTGVGIEYLIEVDSTTYQRYANALTFLMGYKWMPKGYTWVFPMAPNQLKVGAGIIHGDHTVIATTEPLKTYIQRVITDYLQVTDYTLIEVHGSTLKYSSGLQDIYYQGRTIAIGDAVSTVNFLGGEGIRHGMHSAEIASEFIQRYLTGAIATFAPYQTEMHRVFRQQWNLCERLCRQVYLREYDEMVDKVVTYLKPLSREDVVDILFFYRFEKISKGLPQYLLRKLRSFKTRLIARWRQRSSPANAISPSGPS